MNNEGYTLVEMLAALAMIGLAIGGLLEATHVIGRLEAAGGRSIADQRMTRLAQGALSRLLSDEGPFFSDGAHGLSGSSHSFTLPCGEGSCGADLVQSAGRWSMAITSPRGGRSALDLPEADEPEFTYTGERTSGDAWPEPSAPHERLEHVALISGAGASRVALASVRLWVDEPKDCQFDAIAQGCRK